MDDGPATAHGIVMYNLRHHAVWRWSAVHKEEWMLLRLLRSIGRLHGASGFDAYIKGLQRRGLTGGPTADEAKTDYRAFADVAR